MIFKGIYITLIIIYIWYRAIILLISDIKKQSQYPEYKGKISIIIPVYNEEKPNLIALIESIVSATNKLDAEIIIGDDGSKKKVEKVINNLDKDKIKRIKILTLPHRGKRHTQIDCIKLATGEVIVTLDSDILIEKNAIAELVKPFNDKKIGAITGQVKILNESQNWLTKATATMYWNAFNIVRHSLSSFGVVNICSGALSAYRKEVFNKLSDEYLYQTFLGRKCTTGEDRSITNMILREGYDVVYTEKAVCYTVSPPYLIKFIKQQYRWRKSTIRESIITMKFAWKRNKILFLENLYLLLIPFLSVAILTTMIIVWVSNLNLTILILISIFIITIIHNLFLIINDPRKIIHAFIFTLLNYIILIWLWPIALVNVRSTKWGTR